MSQVPRQMLKPESSSPAGPAEPLCETIDAWLDCYTDLPDDCPSPLRRAIRYSLLSQGKRLRPRLVLMAAEACGGTAQAALPAACAVEMVHAYSLVHDDLPAMDDADLRRGRPTLHVRDSEAMAVLAGDVLFGLAFELLADRVAEPSLAGRLCGELATASNDMIAGQVYDTLPDFDAGVAPMARLEQIHRNKTGALIRCACRMGAMCGGADATVLAAITAYAEAVGLMFQVVDDILDVTQTAGHLGKDANHDAVQGKLTYPALLGLEASQAEVGRLHQVAADALAPLGGRADALVALSNWLSVRTR